MRSEPASWLDPDRKAKSIEEMVFFWVMTKIHSPCGG